LYVLLSAWPAAVCALAADSGGPDPALFGLDFRLRKHFR
jgi:hypothetical protein